MRHQFARILLGATFGLSLALFVALGLAILILFINFPLATLVILGLIVLVGAIAIGLTLGIFTLIFWAAQETGFLPKDHLGVEK
jgi:hypothetical protein